MSVPGIGPIISSAMVAAIGRGEVFAKYWATSRWCLAGARSQADIDR